MPTELQQTVRRHWAWRKRGDVRWLPMPIDTIDVPAMYTLLGLYYLSNGCEPTDFLLALEDDLHDVFFDLENFAVLALYTTVEGDSYQIPGIYNYPYEEAIPDVTAGMQSVAPVFKVQETDIIGSVRKGDRLKLCHGSFKILEAKPDGVGCLDLTLHRL